MVGICKDISMRRTHVVSIALILAPLLAMAVANRPVRIDSAGVMRWADESGGEVALCGVNYYVPFALDHALIERRGLDHEAAIREDVIHFQRLGLNSIRLHCWDREISDSEGNLIDNEHLALLDLLIEECKARDIYTVLTPIAWWGAEKTDGFSDRFTIFEMTTQREAWDCQRRYLAQFVRHRNRYSGLRYMDDPAVIAIEVINEPRYPAKTPDTLVTDYINALVSAVKETGCRKPVFYNCWGGRGDAAGASSILDGVTLGWYPTGLVNGRELEGNQLFKVHDFPAFREPAIATKAKMVYEFDAADVHGSYMFPAMAQAFRSGGAQIINQFQYDPRCIAAENTNWQTHCLNLLYTPAKALSFAVAAEAFRRTPRLRPYPSDPEVRRFGEARVSYPEDLSELSDRDVFLYSNHTTTLPPAPAELERLAGCGSSPLVSYDGTGAYFLDRLSPGVWNLQVYPDAVVVRDPYEGGEREKVRLLWETHEMTIRLPDLGDAFTLHVSVGEGAVRMCSAGGFTVSPGEFLLVSRTSTLPEGALARPSYCCPPPSAPTPPSGLVSVDRLAREGYGLVVKASLALPRGTACRIRVGHEDSPELSGFAMRQMGPYQYEGEIPAKAVLPGRLRVFVEAGTADGTFAFPGGIRAPEQRDHLHTFLSVSPGTRPSRVSSSGLPGADPELSVVPSDSPGRHALRVATQGFGPAPSCVSVALPASAVEGLPFEPTAIRARLRGGPFTTAVELGFRSVDGSAFGGDFPVSTVWQDVDMPLTKLRALWGTDPRDRSLRSLTQVSVVFGAWLLPGALDRPHWLEIESLSLSRSAELLTINVEPKDAPVTLVRFADVHVRVKGGKSSTRGVPGMGQGRRALRVSAGPFGPAPDCRSSRIAIPAPRLGWIGGQRPSALLFTVRAVETVTEKLELVMLERDGTPWGTVVRLAPEWQQIRLPLNTFRFFEHWAHPSDRGGDKDAMQVDQLTGINLCFGSWLYGENAGQAHAFEVQNIAVELE